MKLTKRASRLLIAILTIAAAAAAGASAVAIVLYRDAFEHHREHLAQLAHSQAQLIAAVARFDAEFSSDVGGGAAEATLAQVQAAWREAPGFGRTGEFVIARNSGDTVEFIGVNRAGQPLPTLPSGATVGEPMRRALRGESGTVVGLDYAGREVLAAYEWVPELDVGVVAKMDVAEVEEPLLRGVWVAGGFVALLLTIGAVLVFSFGARLTREAEAERARYLALFDGSPDGQFVLAGERFEEVNDRACEMWQCTREQIVGKTPADFSPATQPDGHSSAEAARAKLEAAHDGRPQSFEWRHRRADGSHVDTEITLTAIDLQGEPRILATMRDITSRRKRREEQERLLTVLEQTSDGVGMGDAKGRVFYINNAARTMLGIGPTDDVSGFTVNDFQDPEKAYDVMQAAARHGVWRGEVELRRLDGSRLPISEVVTAHRDEDGTLRYFSTIARDISERREAEREAQRLATAIAQITEGIVITDAQGAIEYVNDATLEITGYTRAELIGENPRILRSGHQPQEFYEEMWNTISAGEVWQGRLVNRRKDGTFYEEEMTITPIRGSDGVIQSYVAAKRDITERALLESQLQQAQKMEAIGQLAGGVAHDFNNMLTGITGYAQLLSRAVDDEVQRADLQQILELSMRAADLTQQLLAFSRRQQLEQIGVDLNQLIGSTLKMLRRLIPESIEVEFDAADTLETVMADSGQIVQVLMNLAVNARDAMPDGGKLIIETANVEFDRDYADSHVEVEPGRYVMMSISDTGLGMDEATQKHIFEPFFTTKGTGEGTGLGLATVYGIVKQHGGHIGVYSEPGVGTAFKVYLPATAVAVADSRREHEGVGELPEIATVLLVEDEEAVREIVERTLGNIGCHVLSAGRSSEARQLYESTEQRIDLLLTDVVMPGGFGTDLYAELRAFDPELKVVFMSGYPDRGAVQLADLPQGSLFLRKPFSPSKLAEYVREILAPAT